MAGCDFDGGERQHLPDHLERLRPCPGRCRPCPARRRAAAHDPKTARAGDTADPRTSAQNVASGAGAYRVCAVRVLIFHGYLLRGHRLERLQRGARRGARARRATRCTCSARSAIRSRWTGSTPSATGTPARCASRRAGSRCARPSTGPTSAGVLPLYVADRYEGIEARPFQDLTDAELEHYLERQRGGGARGGRAGAAGRRAGEPPRDGAG